MKLNKGSEKKKLVRLVGAHRVRHGLVSFKLVDLVEGDTEPGSKLRLQRSAEDLRFPQAIVSLKKCFAWYED